jgi:hypothetical protein
MIDFCKTCFGDHRRRGGDTLLGFQIVVDARDAAGKPDPGVAYLPRLGLHASQAAMSQTL